MSVSVLVPSFNSAPYLGAALRSALDQEPAPVEVIVQDGGSTDETAEVVAALADPRVHLHVEPDRGQSDALNRAAARARGDWLVWLNADDLLYPGAFATALASAEPGVELIIGDFDYIDASGGVLRAVKPPEELSAPRLLAEGCYLFSGACLFRRGRLANLDIGLRYAMDYDLFLRLAPRVRTARVHRALAGFRVHGGSLTSDITWPLLVETARVRRRHGGYGRETRGPVLMNQVKQLVDLGTLPVRRWWR